jgi:hypothetical protein
MREGREGVRMGVVVVRGELVVASVALTRRAARWRPPPAASAARAPATPRDAHVALAAPRPRAAS